MADLVPTPIAPPSTTAALVEAANCTVPIGGVSGAYLEVANGSESPITVTIDTPGADAFGNQIANAVITVGDGDVEKIPLAESVYGPVADVTYSSTTSVTHGAFVTTV